MRPDWGCDHGEPMRQAFQHRHRQPFGVRGKNKNVGIGAQLAHAHLVDPARKAQPFQNAEVFREIAELLDRTASGECRSPAPAPHGLTGETPQKFRHAFSSAEVSKKEQMTRFPGAGRLSRSGRGSGTALWRTIMRSLLSWSNCGDDFQVSPSKYDDCRGAAKHRGDQLFKKRSLAAIILGVIVVMEMQDIAQSDCSGHRQKNNLSNGAAAACDVDMCHTGRRKTRAKQREHGAAQISNGADNM